MAFYEIQECMDYIHEMLEDNADPLGLKFVAYGDENLVPKYPAVLVDGGPMTRTIHGVGPSYILTFNVVIWVYHAKMTISHSVRTREDLALSTAVRDLIHTKPSFDDNVIHGFIDSEIPGIVNRGKSLIVIGTRLNWTGTQRVLT